MTLAQRRYLTEEQLQKLKNLMDRGITLNEWQEDQLLNLGNRGVGKTFLSFIQVAEDLLNGKITPTSTPEQYDSDIHNSLQRRADWFREFKHFIEEYYNEDITLRKGTNGYSLSDYIFYQNCIEEPNNSPKGTTYYY